MGIAVELINAILREAAHKPFSGTALTLGRQTVQATPDQMRLLFAQAGVQPAAVEAKVDTATTAVRAHGGDFIRDIDFLRMLGFDTVQAMDISDFEGAEVLWDLNRPIPDRLAGSCDFLVDGSTLDNIFDPATGLKNIARLLRPGGRCFLINLGNCSPEFGGIPYTMFNPLWFYDFFAWNGFESCEVYTHVMDQEAATPFALSHDHAARVWDPGLVRPIASPHSLAVCVLAEKGADSTWDRTPTQHAYRSEEDWKTFEAAVARFQRNARPPLLRGGDKPRPEIPPGWRQVRSDGALAESV